MYSLEFNRIGLLKCFAVSRESRKCTPELSFLKEPASLKELASREPSELTNWRTRELVATLPVVIAKVFTMPARMCVSGIQFYNTDALALVYSCGSRGY